MMWWGILADVGLDLGIWVEGRSISWEAIASAIKLTSEAMLRQWLRAARPLVSALCGVPPRTQKGILMQLIADNRAWRRTLQVRSPKALKIVRQQEVTRRMFRILNRRMDAAFDTQPEEVDRWNKIMECDTSEKAVVAKGRIREDLDRAQRTGDPLDYLGRWMWQDARLHNLLSQRSVYRVHDDPALYRPRSFETVLARFFRYLGLFLALGIGTTVEARPVPPLPDSRPLPITCRLCQVYLHTEVNNQRLLGYSQGEFEEWLNTNRDDGIVFWCPCCFQEWIRSFAHVRLIMDCGIV
jgi:hypothetical protein